MKNKEKANQLVELTHSYEEGLQYLHNDRVLFENLMEMAEWKDSQTRDLLIAYTKWLDTRGFFAEDLQCDFGHQVDTFLEMSNIKVDKGE